MTELRMLQPHDPVPEGGRYMLVLRRFGEDSPRTAITEIITADGRDPPEISVALLPNAQPMDFRQAVQQARAEAERSGFGVIYAVDRTAGPQERAVLEHEGNRTTGMEHLSDTDPEDGEMGTDIRDRPRDAGYNLRPER